MRKGLPKILITGAAGFIGSAFLRLAVKFGCKIIIVDNLTYAGDLKRIAQIRRDCIFYKADICDTKKVELILKKERPRQIINFAAQTHVDRSIINAGPFLKTNIQGTKVLLDLARKYGMERFVHISTDEVYGDIAEGKFSEDSPLRPNSPYAASKASADLLINSYIRTYSFPAIIVRPSNNYGPWQYPEKLIPLAILKIFKNERIPIYAQGRNIREWLYVQDCAAGIWEVFKHGRIGEIYNLGSGQEWRNIEVVRMILKILGAVKDMIQFVKDRPGHDIRYSLNSRKVYKHTGWKPKIKFDTGIKMTVEWYLRHRDWLFSKYKDIKKLYQEGA